MRPHPHNALAEGHPGRRRPGIDAAAESRRLEAEAAQAASAQRLAGMRATRAKLPAASHRDAVLQRVGAHRVLVVSGATGAPLASPHACCRFFRPLTTASTWGWTAELAPATTGQESLPLYCT